MAKRTLYLITYDRGKHPITSTVKPYHWSYFIYIEIREGQPFGVAHQLHGMPGSFAYRGPEHVDPSEPSPIKEQLEVGEVDDLNLERMHEILSSVHVDQSESSGWNCQDWTLERFEMLKGEGYV
ncbi:hypothetical protein ACJ41O_010220 [Fusarium nematophilum]